MSGQTLDTIVAPATPVGRSALAVVRIDGPRALAILQGLGAGDLKARTATLVRLTSGGEPIDECIAVWYAAPQSYTGNDLVELSLHGNPLLIARVLEEAVQRGARIAEPGEFTERAVLNGKIDLVQAESIADLIAARTPLQAKVSIANLNGVLSDTANSIRESLLFVIARLEAALDFSDEGYEFVSREEATRRVRDAIAAAERLADTYRRGRATAGGLSAVILGRPNAGKSTLLNRLVGTERAIVTPIPGTTRDIVTETIEIGGLPVTLADTAGLRESEDVVEGLGIARAREAADRADIVLYLIDASAGTTEEDRAAVSRYREMQKDVVEIYTKTDLAVPPADAIGVSVVEERGIDQLLRLLDGLVRDRFAVPEGSVTLVNERQRAAIGDCLEGLRNALDTFERGFNDEVVLVDLYRASTALGLLVGAITRDELLDEIFVKFCIGK